MYVLLFDVFFSSIKEINRLISKGMSNIHHWQKTDVLKTYRKWKFLGNRIWRNALALKSK